MKTSNVVYGTTGKNVPRRARLLLIAQGYKCSDCENQINGHSYFDYSSKLKCGSCALGLTKV